MKRFLIFLIILSLPAIALGQVGRFQPLGPTVVGGTAKVAQTGANFLQIGVSARTAGMAGAFVALANDASAVFYNPGAISRLEGMQSMFTHTTLPAEIKHFFGSFVYPLAGDMGTIAFHTVVLTTGEMPVTRSYIGPTGETFSNSEVAAGMTYSRNLTDRFSVGGTVKYIQQNLSGFVARSFAADFGTYFLAGFRDLRFGMTVRNFGPDMTFGTIKEIGFDSQDYPLPMDFRFGAAMTLYEYNDSNLMFSFELSQPNDNLRRENVGLEYTFMDMLFVRGGYKLEYDGEDYAVGTGLKVPVGEYSTTFDASWQHSEYLNDLIKFSVGFAF